MTRLMAVLSYVVVLVPLGGRADHVITGRRSTLCPAVEARCLARCEMEGAENRLNGHIYSHKEMSRCLDRCEEEFCPPPEEEDEEDERRRRLSKKAKKATTRKEGQQWPRPFVGPGRALVAVPRDNYEVFLSWRLLEGDSSFVIYRRSKEMDSKHREGWSAIGQSKISSYLDEDVHLVVTGGSFEYYVEEAQSKASSRVATARPKATGRDYVTLAGPGTPQISNALFADTDGDGELEAVVWRKTADGKYSIAVIELLSDDVPSVRSFDNDLGGRATAAKNERGWLVVEGVRGKALKEAPGSETSLWSRPRAAGDVDGDGREEIWTTAVFKDGKCRYVLLKDDGISSTLRVMASVESPYPLCDGADNSRHDCFVANLDGDPSRLSVGLMGGRHEPWRIFMFDFDISQQKLVPRWDAGSSLKEKTLKEKQRKAAYANKQTSHNAAIVDVDCDGRDEILAGATAIDDDGSLLWDANAWFGKSAHVDGVVVDDVDHRLPGFEVVLFSETGPEFGVYRAIDGSPVFEGVAPGYHLQWNIAVNVSGRPGFLDVVGTYGGHFVDGGSATLTDSTSRTPFPFADWPREAHNWHPIDWDGGTGHQTAIFGYCLKSNFSNLGGCDPPPPDFQHRPKVFGLHGREVFRVVTPEKKDTPDEDREDDDDEEGKASSSSSSSNAAAAATPEKKSTNRRDVISRSVTNAVDVVGDHREELIVQMADGAVRAYLNARAPALEAKPTKLQDYHYRRFLAHAAFPSHVAALGATCRNDGAPPADFRPVQFFDTGADVAKLRSELNALKRRSHQRRNNDHRTLRSNAIAVKRELILARARVDLRRHIANLTQFDTLAITKADDLDTNDTAAAHQRDPSLVADLPLQQPFEQSCSRKRFGFCFGRSTKVGILIKEEDDAIAANLKAKEESKKLRAASSSSSSSSLEQGRGGLRRRP
eukprot:CAMPEP_0118907814 /NCGR_PEP_ID=MMETSP1166-20130328/11098_1 /TAXON_ID=1104430 /ORGANISM="Chrysoreinhardia sp, Strain CCMP3193" /LENGTH=935 /DNA_ID=CAMNT_0006847191 /DNA_START=28 /DNA_END=2835 /DNA_ORIENTATION=+